MSTRLHIKSGTESNRTHCGRTMNRPTPTDPTMVLCVVCQRAAEKFHHGKITAEYQDGRWAVMVQQAPPFTIAFDSAMVVNLETGEKTSYNAEELAEIFKKMKEERTVSFPKHQSAKLSKQTQGGGQ